ncbi:hypothetical protein [Breoghania sp.]|uniref:hypothetical protein n=1 Tax=Breoghania sp. TaxID=2065378 RepID=UPI002617F8B5|nr:hypothetical protein [Breoghania sp.]MDJ0932106.1 hypothetical protein [Breoghania sp.]
MCSDLAEQFDELRGQFDKLSDDSSYNGINLLRGDNLKLTFNETGTSTINIQTKDGEIINAAYLGLSDLEASDLDFDDDIDTLLAKVKEVLNTVRSQASTFGSNLPIVENRTEFTKMMMNTLETGADNLVLANGNEEAANMLALQDDRQHCPPRRCRWPRRPTRRRSACSSRNVLFARHSKRAESGLNAMGCARSGRSDRFN